MAKRGISNIAAGGSNMMEITVKSAYVTSFTAASIKEDKLLFAVFVVDSDSLSSEEIKDLTEVTHVVRSEAS